MNDYYTMIARMSEALGAADGKAFLSDENRHERICTRLQLFQRLDAFFSGLSFSEETLAKCYAGYCEHFLMALHFSACEADEAN